MIELWRSDRSQQNCVSSETGVERASRQWLASLLDRLAAGRVLFEMKVMAVSACDLAQDTHGLFSHFRPHTVTRKDHDIKIHSFVETPSQARPDRRSRLRGGSARPFPFVGPDYRCLRHLSLRPD